MNNAGIIGPLRPLSETSSEEWWRTMEVNLKGPLLATEAVIPGMIEQAKPRPCTSVNVTSAGRHDSDVFNFFELLASAKPP